MKRTILTGASGFIGANLARKLLQDGHDVHLLLRKEYLKWRIEDILKDVSIHIVDLCDKEALEKALKSIRPEWIFHLAAYGNYSWQDRIDRIFQTNLFGTINLIEASRKIGFDVFINTGSSSEYGLKNYPPSEIECIDPNSYYAIAKASASLYCRYTAQKHKINIITLRLYSAYGLFEEPRRLIPTVIIKGLNGKLPPLVKPDVVRDFVYIDDVVRAYCLAAETKDLDFGAIYNIGSGIQITMENIIEIAKRVLKIDDSPNWGSMENRIWDTSVWVANNQKAKKILNWNVENTFEEGFSKTVSWFRNNHAIASYYLQSIGKKK